MAEPKQGGDANAFIQEYGPIAERIGKQLNVDPRIILAQFGVETGWGKSVVPGTYNLGNIKSAGKGVEATDNVTKTKDRYLKFEDPEVFADYYAQYMKRQFPEVVGAGSNVDTFTKALRPGQKGGYAEDAEYGPKLSNAFSLVNARIESQKGDDYDKAFGVGTPTVAQTMGEETDTTTTSGGNEEQGGMSKEDAALYGAGAGFLSGMVAGRTKPPTSAKYEAAIDRLNDARARLAEAQKSGVGGQAMADLENELRLRQSAASQAADELKLAEAELKAARGVTSAAPSAPSAPGAAPEVDTRKIAGSSGSANWARKMSDEIPDVVAESATSMRKADEKGAQRLIDKDVAARQKLQRMGLGDYELSGRGTQQLALPTNVAAERATALEAELAQRQAADAAQRAQLDQQAQARTQAAEQRVQAAKQARRQAGTAVGEQSQAVREARSGQKAVERAQSGVNVAEARVERTPKGTSGVLGKTGEITAKVAPKALGVISGAATGMAAMEAIERFKAGDYTGAVLPTLEATFGVMSMLPPAHPILAALRGLGTLGGGALLGYEAYKYGTREKPESVDYQAP